MNGAPRVSVIVPFFDPEPRFLSEAVESVLAQRLEKLRWRRAFLDWTHELVRGSGIQSRPLDRAIRIEKWALDHPRGARLLRVARRLRRRLPPWYPAPRLPPEAAP